VRNVDTTQDPMEAYKERMQELRLEARSINLELGRPDLFALAQRAQELVRRSKGLLDGNTTILFEGQPDRVAENLYEHVDYARGHIRKALAEEHEFEAIKRHLYMATSLAEYVIDGVEEAVSRIEAQQP
jgi:ribosomal protein L10